MGTWGPGVFENDHALEICSTQVKRLADAVEEVLARNPVAFDDLEGPLVYVHMLLLLAQECDLEGLDRETVARWKEKYLNIFLSTSGPDYPDYVTKRKEVISREFDSLAARLHEPQPQPTPKKQKKKVPKKAPAA
jgi:hypothetical protein